MSIMSTRKGFTLIEVIVASSLGALIFVAIIIGFRTALEITAEVRAKSSALWLVNNQMEFIRSLNYNDIGTVEGIPSGPIPQFSTTTLSGREFTTRTLIRWVDDPADGLGAEDYNNITTDYKEVKVEVTWETRGSFRSLDLLSRVTPPGIESDVGGGTVRIEVYDRDFLPLPGTSVWLQNQTTTSTISVTQGTNVDGVALFYGAPQASQYEVMVSRPGYSTEQTHKATTSLPNPNRQPFTVVENETTTLSFRIDELSNLSIQTLDPSVVTHVTDNFDPPLTVATTTNLDLLDGTFRLLDTLGIYESNGTILGNIVTPGTFSHWETASFVGVTPDETQARMRVVSAVGTSSIDFVPNSDLPGNSTGFMPGVVDISNLDVATYPELGLFISLGTASSTNTPEIFSWSISYVASETPQSNVPLRVRGNKVLGTDSEGVTIYKYDEIHTSDVLGSISLLDMEWDTYHLVPQNPWVIVSACPSVPYELDPGVDKEVSLQVVSDTSDSLRVIVQDGEIPISGAIVELSRSGFSEEVITDTCGQAFFSVGVVEADDYVVRVETPGYQEVEFTSIDISSNTSVTISISS